MMNRELLDHLRALNAADAELRHHEFTREEREARLQKIQDLRALIPTALLGHHDSMAAQGRESVAPVEGGSCGACHAGLPVGQLAELHQPGRIGVCPQCGVFLFSGEAETSASQS